MRLPRSSSGRPITARRPHARMLVERGLDLGRVHVRAAGEDHVGLAVVEVHVAVGVDRAHVAERLPTAVDALAPRRRRSGTCARLGVGRPHEDLADLARIGVGAVGAHDLHLARALTVPTEPRCSSHSTPVMIVAACASVPAYSSQIVSGAEPVDPLLLQPRRARRARGATRPSATTRRSGRARRAGSFEMRAIIVGTTYIESGWYRSIELQRALGVELAAEHHVVAREQRGHRPHERTVVVQRPGHHRACRSSVIISSGFGVGIDQRGRGRRGSASAGRCCRPTSSPSTDPTPCRGADRRRAARRRRPAARQARRARMIGRIDTDDQRGLGELDDRRRARASAAATTPAVGVAPTFQHAIVAARNSTQFGQRDHHDVALARRRAPANASAVSVRERLELGAGHRCGARR